jgi:hypothetical protein
MVRLSMRLRSILGAGLLCAPFLVTPVASANGDDFFVPNNDGPPVLRYYGHVRDAAGNPIGSAFIFFEVKHPHAYVRAKTFPDGGYQSPDLGDYIQAIGGDIDYHQIEIRCLKDGWVTARPPAPPSNSGRVQLDIVMTPEK